MSTADERDRSRCIFCDAWASADDVATLSLWRWEHCFALLNRYPYTSGHVMVAPREHVAQLDDLTQPALAEMMTVAQKLVRALRQQYRAHGFNVGFNLGEAAGAGIEEHLHLHVVPRWWGDTNFMTAVGRTRVIPEDLERTHGKIVAAIAAQEAGAVGQGSER